MRRPLHPPHLYPSFLVFTSWFLSCSALRAAPVFGARRSMSMTAILDSPSAQRNKEPIWNVLAEKVIPLVSQEEPLKILEIAAGCGVHTEHFASRLLERGQSFRYLPCDMDAISRASIQARIQQSKLTKDQVETPLALTLNADGIVEPETASALDGQDLDLIICINMIHISPWDATRGLMKLAGAKLRKGGILFCYGPYKVGGTAVESNLNFDRSLRMQDPGWGVRDIEAVVEEAEARDMTFKEKIEMPANNLSVIYLKQ